MWPDIVYFIRLFRASTKLKTRFNINKVGRMFAIQQYTKLLSALFEVH
jgi:hypothetical protein